MLPSSTPGAARRSLCEGLVFMGAAAVGRQEGPLLMLGQLRAHCSSLECPDWGP